jgi:hypothetical protein
MMRNKRFILHVRLNIHSIHAKEIMMFTRHITIKLTMLMAAMVLAMLATPATYADPLPGKILKFVQDPMVATPVDGAIYFGHDEESTLYDMTGIGQYQGFAMADDFADEFDTPVVHVRWWGSYLGNQFTTPISKFLIAFESDQPVNAANNFSHPKDLLLAQVVTAGPLAPASGTFTEAFVFSPPAGVGEDLYEYNAELKLPFNQHPGTVYWLKIAALVDSPNDTVRWGWHNRDYTIMDPLASPAVFPGEFIEGVTAGDTPVWHFQDDAVSAETFLSINADGILNVDQTNYIPQHYVDGVDGPAASVTFPGISQFSKDLGFELYTIPEPASVALFGLGAIMLLKRRKC